MHLTDRYVAAAKCEGRPQLDIFDSQVKGLALRVSATGRKTWTLFYTRAATGKRARVTLGTYPELGVAKAREKATIEKGAIGEGADPAAQKKAERAAMRIGELVSLYVERHASGLRSGTAIKRRLEKNITAVIGDVKLAELHRRDFTRALDRIVDRGRLTQANRVFEDARAMIRWAVGKGYLDSSPIEQMKRPARTESRDRVLAPEEIRTLWHRLPDAAMSEATRRIVRLCLITAQRVGEVAGMRRDELDLARALWSLPGSRTKNGQAHDVPLSPQALAVLSEALEASPEVCPFVFPSPGGQAAIAGHAIATAVRRSQEPIGLPHWTAHDLRRTALTEMAKLGINPLTLGHVANHVSTTRATVTTAVYARYSYDREKRAALDAWGERLEGIVGQGAAVLPMRGRADV
jgi:integrase